jgi:hypothetical protein
VGFIGKSTGIAFDVITYYSLCKEFNNDGAGGWLFDMFDSSTRIGLRRIFFF